MAGLELEFSLNGDRSRQLGSSTRLLFRVRDSGEAAVAASVIAGKKLLSSYLLYSEAEFRCCEYTQSKIK